MILYLPFKFAILGAVTRLLSKNVTMARSNVGLPRAIHVGVLYRYENSVKHEIVQRFVRALKNMDKKVSVLCYVTAKEQGDSYNQLIHTFKHDAVTALGKVVNTRVEAFIESPFDYLFHLDFDTNPILDFIVAKHRAKCRVGHFDPVRRYLFEMMVKVRRTTPADDMERLTKQVLHYTGCMGH